jgi:hypothetical protein
MKGVAAVPAEKSACNHVRRQFVSHLFAVFDAKCKRSTRVFNSSVENFVEKTPCKSKLHSNPKAYSALHKLGALSPSFKKILDSELLFFR